MKLVKSRWLINYPVDHLKDGYTQEKNLISYDDYINIIKPLQEKIEYHKSLKSDKDKELVFKFKRELKSLIGEDDFFVERAGLFKAIETGILELPNHMGGNHKCIIKHITNY